MPIIWFVHPIQSSLTLLYRIYLLQKIALAQAYRGRKLDSIFNESEYITIAILSIFQSFLIGIPLMFMVHDYPTAYYFTQVAICYIISAATALLIFVPKIVFMWRGGFEENPERYMRNIFSSIRTNQTNPSSKVLRFDDNSSRVLGGGNSSRVVSGGDSSRVVGGGDSSRETSNASRVTMDGNVEQA